MESFNIVVVSLMLMISSKIAKIGDDGNSWKITLETSIVGGKRILISKIPKRLSYREPPRLRRTTWTRLLLLPSCAEATVAATTAAVAGRCGGKAALTPDPVGVGVVAVAVRRAVVRNLA